MRTLRDLLTTWETWSARDTLTLALAVATDDRRERITTSLAEMPSASALDALREATELVELLTGWRWQATYAARWDGASWEQIGAALPTTAELARTGYATVLDRQERVLGREVTTYREVL